MPAPTTWQRPGCINPGGTNPAGYDREIEILMTLPHGQPASIRMLAGDFRYTIKKMMAVLRMLARDYGVMVDEDLMEVVVPESASRKVRDDCEEYHVLVYGF